MVGQLFYYKTPVRSQLPLWGAYSEIPELSPVLIVGSVDDFAYVLSGAKLFFISQVYLAPCTVTSSPEQSCS